MDEVFLLADPDCPRCAGKDPADLFAGEVAALHSHLKKVGCTLWLWGDRYLDGKATGIGKWEASENGTYPAVDRIPSDVVVCDWHYRKAYDTARLFAERGIRVVSCPWRKPDVALRQLEMILALREDRRPEVSSRALGMVQTTWCGFSRFVQAYHAQDAGEKPTEDSAGESARCFRELFAAIREHQKHGPTPREARDRPAGP
jgi:hypothetical protein